MIAEALIVSAILFVIGVVGVLTRRNAIILFMCAELMLNAVNLSFVALAKMHNVTGQVFVVMVMTIAAAEAAVGLAILISVFRHFGTVDLSSLRTLHPMSGRLSGSG
jgi:NADH-quinone oxidoreductase subunit K